MAFTAVAAALLLVGLFWLWTPRQPHTRASQWELAAFSEADEPDTQLVTWVVSDLSRRRR
jgi:hypothetical protein